MDLSKLPRLSETDKHAPPPADPQSADATPGHAQQPLPMNYIPAPASRLEMGAQVWLSLILGVVFMMMGWNFARWAIATISGQEFHTRVTWAVGPNAGQEVSYFELQGYTAYSDMGIFLFGLATLLEGIIFATMRRNTRGTRSLVLFTMLLTAGMTLLNAGLAILLLQAGIMPFVSIIAAGFGGYMTIYQWQLFQQMRSEAAWLAARGIGSAVATA